MEFVIAFTLIAVFLLGFFLRGRLSFSKKKAPQENCSHSYAQGLNYLLANESDKAIQLFVDLIKVDGETAETHLALGKLFRSRGEVDKAIKIHINILAKPSLELKQRILVLFELGKDYLSAGLLDRAENVFKELLELDENNIQALVHLQNLYIAEKSWLEAIVYSEQLKKLNYKDSQQILTHCYCELAETKARNKDFHLSRQYLDIAINYDPKCVRAYILKLNVEIEERKFKLAANTLELLMTKHINFVHLFLPQIYDFFKKQDKVSEYAGFLEKYNQRSDNLWINKALLEFYFENTELERAHQLLSAVLDNDANLEIFEIALEKLSHAQFGEEKYEQLREFLKTHNLTTNYFACQQCGYTSHVMQWQCPSCNAWSSMRDQSIATS